MGAMNRLADKYECFPEMRLKEICKEAHISKPTFYRHFSNKEDAVRWHVDQVARISLTRIGIDFTVSQGIELMLAYISEFRYLYELFGKTERDNPMILKSYTEQVFSNAIINTLATRIRIPITHEIEFQVHALYDVLHGAFERWRLEGLKEIPSDVAKMCSESAPAHLTNLLDNNANTDVTTLH